jgi:hypothetical protein
MPRRMRTTEATRQAQNGQGVDGYGIYSTQSGHWTWLFPPTGNAGANNQSSSDVKRRDRYHYRPFSFRLQSLLVTQAPGPLGPLFTRGPGRVIWNVCLRGRKRVIGKVRLVRPVSHWCSADPARST